MRLVGKISNVNLIRKIAWSFHKTTGIEWEELFSEALFKYVLLLKEYDLEEDSSKGKISTYIWTSISNGLKSYIEQKGKIYQPLEHIDNIDELDWNNYNSSPFWEGLTEEAQGVARLVIKYSEHFVCLTPEQVEQRIYYILIRMGWKKEKILSGINNLKQVYGQTF
jgi:hypothetical protein